ncbi:MAG: hypothetical protein KDI22_05245, partial [Gammaproteobacteria bacterium]|nr:hypothetical protein [Gammaproteobacteria bacterium]
MQHLLLQFARHPRLWLAFLLAASVLAATQLGELRVRVAADEMLVINDPQRAYYEKIKQAFGEEKVVLLILEDEQLLAPEKLAVLKEVVDQLAGLPFVQRTESLFSVPYVKSIEGYLDKEPYLATLPDTPEAGAELLTAALKNPLIRNLLVSPGGNAMAVAIVLKDGN